MEKCIQRDSIEDGANIAKRRKQYTGEKKVAILRKHRLEAVPLSDICDERELQSPAFFRRQQQLFELGATVFCRQNDTEGKELLARVHCARLSTSRPGISDWAPMWFLSCVFLIVAPVMVDASAYHPLSRMIPGITNRRMAHA